MSTLLDQAVDALRQMPPSEQEEIARTILRLVGRDEVTPVPLSDHERAAIQVSKAAAARGEFASDEDVERVWAKHGV